MRTQTKKNILLIDKETTKSLWESESSFPSSFFDRMKLMAHYIPNGSKVIDLGCGPMWLKRLLPVDCVYIPVDFVKHGKNILLSDFNKYEFPNIKANVGFCAGVLEYIIDYRWFIKQLSLNVTSCILSYNTYDNFPDKHFRNSLNWVNSLGRKKIVSLFSNVGFKLLLNQQTDDNEDIFFFEKK